MSHLQLHLNAFKMHNMYTVCIMHESINELGAFAMNTHTIALAHTLFQINMIWNLHRNSQTKNSVKIFQSMRFHSLIASYLYDFGIQFEFHHMNNKRCVIFFSFIWFFFRCCCWCDCGSYWHCWNSYVRAFFFWESIYLLKWYPFWANQAQKLSISYVSSIAWVYTAHSRNVRKR